MEQNKEDPNKERINPGKFYRQYLEEAYGPTKAHDMMQRESVHVPKEKEKPLL